MYVPLSSFRVAPKLMCGLLISSGSEVEVKGGRALFGLDLERGAGMVWEQLTCNFSVGPGMYAIL